MRKQKLWLTRDGKRHQAIPICLWSGSPPFWNDVSEDWRTPRNGCFLEDFCTRDFTRITGIRLKPGECREVESIVIKLKEPT